MGFTELLTDVPLGWLIEKPSLWNPLFRQKEQVSLRSFSLNFVQSERLFGQKTVFSSCFFQKGRLIWTKHFVFLSFCPARGWIWTKVPLIFPCFARKEWLFGQRTRFFSCFVFPERPWGQKRCLGPCFSRSVYGDEDRSFFLALSSLREAVKAMFCFYNAGAVLFSYRCLKSGEQRARARCFSDPSLKQEALKAECFHFLKIL